MRTIAAFTILLALHAPQTSALAASSLAASSPRVDRIVVDKSERKLTLFAAGKEFKTYRVALGANPVGDKEREGDDRTPEGRYIIDAKNAASSFHRALHISYPDKRDRAQARRRGVTPGGAIMIHGTPAYIELLYAAGAYPDWTAGCIAVRNTEIEELFKLVPIGTPIEIVP